MKFKAPGEEPMMIGITSGHTLVITNEKGGTEVPVQFRKEAIARGCVPVGMGVEQEQAPQTDSTRQEKIIAAIEQMLDGDDEEAFTADGKPDVRKLSAVAGFSIAREERDTAWEIVSKKIGPADGE